MYSLIKKDQEALFGAQLKKRFLVQVKDSSVRDSVLRCAVEPELLKLWTCSGLV